MKIEIDLQAYAHNIALLSERMAPARVMAIVKDDAYGHGLDRILHAALGAGISAFGVLDIATALRVRKTVPDREIQLFAWLFSAGEDFSPAIAERIDLGVSDVAVLDAVASCVTEVPARVHLKIDSGLHRNGSSVKDWPTLLATAKAMQDAGTVEVVGIWTHIGEASDDEDDLSQAIYEQACADAASMGITFTQRHLAASAASYARPSFRYDFARVGGFTYGIAPGSGLGPADLGLLPVMSARTEITGSENGDPAGTSRVGAGYLDGIPDWCLDAHTGQLASLPRPGFEVLIGSQRFPILRVEAQTLLIDTSTSGAPIVTGDDVVLFGSHRRNEPVLQEWADAIGTVGEELVVRMGPRGTRLYLDN